MAICLDVVVVLRTALHIHAAGIPIALFGDALRTPVSPHSELRVLKPFRVAVSLQRFPIGPEGTGNRAAGKTAVRVAVALAEGSAGAEGKQTESACNKLPPAETAGVKNHRVSHSFARSHSCDGHCKRPRGNGDVRPEAAFPTAYAITPQVKSRHS